MAKTDLKKAMQELIVPADIQINGKKPWDIQVINQDLYSRVLAGGILAIMPGKASIAVWPLGLDVNAKSQLGTLALEMLAGKTGWNLFGP